MATWFMMQAAARRWRDAGVGGSIVNIVVITSAWPLRRRAYGRGARGRDRRSRESVAVEWAPLGIRVNCIAPGSIETEGWKVYTPEARARYPRYQSDDARRDGMGYRRGLRLSPSAAGGFVTGDLLTVDGGGQLWGETWTTGKPDYFKT